MTGAVLITGIVAFAGPRLWNGADGVDHPGYLALLLPALMWGAFRYGPIAASALSLIALAPGVALSVNGFGPFSGGRAGASDLQILILAIAGTTLLVGVLGATLRAARDRAAAADRAKTLFLSRIGHELRTPLNGVIGAADLLARDLEDAPAVQQDRLDLVRSSARTLAAVVEDLVEFAAIHREGVSIRPMAFEAAQPFEDAAAIFGPQAQWNNVALRLDVASLQDVWIVTDPSRLRQVLFAIVANAVEATTAGEIVVAAKLLPHPRGLLLEAIVRDTGAGMTSELLARAFDPFVAESEDRNRPSRGLGLGLAVARETVAALGGEIKAESTPGKGSAFRIAIPVERGAPPSGRLASTRIPALVAEDNPTGRIVLTAMLTALGLDVVAVETGAEALEAVQKRDFAVILMDIQMPVMDGEEAIERIRALDGPRGRTPIIVVTAHALSGDDRRYMAAGANRVVAKPVDQRALAEAIAAVMGQKPESVA